MLVGEQPGDREDLAEETVRGAASRELNRALRAASIEHSEAYLTNVVKHFKFEERGGRRIHQTPKRFEVEACRPWFDEELKVVRPDALVVLGATAAKALMAATSASRPPAASCSTPRLAEIVTATVTRPRSCAARTRTARQIARRSSPTCAWLPGRSINPAPAGRHIGERTRQHRGYRNAVGGQERRHLRRERCGIGGAMARAFAAEGARVFLTGTRETRSTHSPARSATQPRSPTPTRPTRRRSTRERRCRRRPGRAASRST